MLRILQVTDCHLLPNPDATLLGVNTHASLTAVLRTACREHTPDALLATGDIAQRPTPATYRLFLATVRRYFAGPVLCVPGNHDHGATLAAELPTDDLRLGDWRLLGLDTHIDDQVGGSVDAGALGRVRNAPPGPTVLVGHHCPVEIDCPWLDKDRIDRGGELIDAMGDAEVAAYAFGHIHQPFERTVGAMLLVGTPSTCFQFARGTPTFAIDDAEPGYRWLMLGDDGDVTSRIERVAFPLNIDLGDRANR